MTLFFALSEREALLVSIRTKAALAAKKKRDEQIGGTKELWGKKTKTNRQGVLEAARKESAKNRKDNAKNNGNNARFWTFMQKWINSKGEPKNVQIWADIASELNEYNFKTATGMTFNSVRASAMYRNLKKIMR